MKKKTVILVTIIALLAGCLSFWFVCSTTAKGLYGLFVRELGVEAVCDVRIRLVDRYDNVILYLDEDEQFSIWDIKSKLKEQSKGQSVYYTYLYEETDNPILALLVPGGSNSIYKDSYILSFSIKDGKIHLVNFRRPLDDGGEINLANNGMIISETELSDERNHCLDAYYVGQDGQINNCFFWDTNTVFYYVQNYNNKISSFFSYYYKGTSLDTLITVGIGDKYYTYFDGEDNGFLAYAPQYGLKVVIDEDVLKKMVNEDLKNLGIDFNVEDFFNLEDDYVDWKEL